MALVQALRARNLDDLPLNSLCIVPSWTFVASPAAILLAGMIPYFADVAAETWSLDPSQLGVLVERLRTEGKTVAAVMPVAPFGAPIDVAAWEAFETTTGVPVVIDAAASFDSLTMAGGLPPVPVSHIPIVVSLHATKVFGIGEGGFVITSDAALADRIRRFGNFGFFGSREACLPGWNSKLGEMYAAVGLAQFDQWADTRQEWVDLTIQFRELAAPLAPHAHVPDVMVGDWVSTYGLLQLNDHESNLPRIMNYMTEHGVETRCWWGGGCHQHPAYNKFGREDLVQTERLGKTVLGLPFWRKLPRHEMARSFSVLADALAADT